MNILAVKSLLASIIIICVSSFSCSKDKEAKSNYYNIESLPADTGGVHISKPLNSTGSPYGYYVYQPSYYNDIEEVVFPTLIFLHGAGEKGNSSNNPEDLKLVLRNGPPDMIEDDEWSPAYPMLVFSPQCHDGTWNASKLKAFTEYLIANYKVNVQRIYLTGLSMGGYGTFQYIGRHSSSSYIAAAVPICGGGNTSQASNFNSIPLWVFHGDADNVVSVNNSIKMVDAINAKAPKYRAKLTIFPGVKHNSWTMTYTGSGMGRESKDDDAFDESIYDWMFNYYRADLDSLAR